MGNLALFPPSRGVTMTDNLSSRLRLWLRQRARDKTYGLTEWHIELGKQMAERAGVSQNQIVKTALEYLAINFDPSLFRKDQPHV